MLYIKSVICCILVHCQYIFVIILSSYCTSMIFTFLIMLLFLVFITSTLVHAFSNNVTDQQALLSIKASISADPLGMLSSWNNSIHFCEWNGITCSRRRQRVTTLNFTSQQLVGTLSPHVGNLSFLKTIILRKNNFYGAIPNEIGRLFRLQYISLTNNSFQGGFPANLSHCLDIRTIAMYHNKLVGKLPADQFSSWSKLNYIDLGGNSFTGTIPPSIGNLSSLNYLDLRRNNLVGGIPLEVAYLARLEVLIVNSNNLSGVVPLPIYNISSLYLIDFSTNELKGKFPEDMGFTLPKLQWLYVGENSFSGPLPPSIANASKLVIIDVSYKNMTRPVPMNLGSLPNLEWLNLGGNSLGNNHPSDDLSFFNSLINCTHLRILSSFYNGLRGDLPNSIANLSTTIDTLSLRGNYIYGRIPHEIGKLVSMTRLDLSENFLTGTIPESIGELSKLGELFLSENNISSQIPSSIGNITGLYFLSLRDNMLQGSIPSALFNVSNLQELSLANNGLGGVIPEQIVGLSSQCLFLDLDQNLFTGPLPSNIGNFKQLVELYVSNNRLTGDVPATLGACVMLEKLHMEGNLFEGKIPASFKALKSLVILDLSWNNLSGDVPRFFDGFHLIEFLNLSHNKLGGELPKEGLFSNVTAFSVVGNLQFCGGIQALHLPACPAKVSRNKKKAFSVKILHLVLFPLAFLLACLAFLFLRQRKSKLINVPVPVLQDNHYPRLSYQDLLIATNEFSSNNFLGEGKYGSVYKGFLESLDKMVAVKVLNVEVRGANKSFMSECETLRNIRHRNLIKIISACSSTDFNGNDFKALVFEFMTNGSVDDWLHPSPYQQNERNLTLLQRLNISIDVAQGVAYLHHYSHTSIIHCDIKPSNILLDEEFVARVNDFGLARVSFARTSDINQAQTSSTGVRGTIGYVPPEYGMGGEISVEGDDYSYGIFVLELFSGKRPTSRFDNADNLHDYVKKALPQRVMDIADSRLILEEDEQGLTAYQAYNRVTMEACLTSILTVGILCSVEAPSERIDISVAIKQLHVARDKTFAAETITCVSVGSNFVIGLKHCKLFKHVGNSKINILRTSKHWLHLHSFSLCVVIIISFILAIAVRI